jgi:hypothetical protein
VLQLDEGLFSSTPAAADEAAAEGAATVEDQFLTMLATFVEEGRNVSPSPSSSFAPTLFAKDERAGGIKKAAFARAMNRLIADRRVPAHRACHGRLGSGAHQRLPNRMRVHRPIIWPCMRSQA